MHFIPYNIHLSKVYLRSKKKKKPIKGKNENDECFPTANAPIRKLQWEKYHVFPRILGEPTGLEHNAHPADGPAWVSMRQALGAPCEEVEAHAEQRSPQTEGHFQKGTAGKAAILRQPANRSTRGLGLEGGFSLLLAAAKPSAPLSAQVLDQSGGLQLRLVYGTKTVPRLQVV